MPKKKKKIQIQKKRDPGDGSLLAPEEERDGVVVVVVVDDDDDGGRGDTLLFVAARILSCTTGIQWSRPCSNRDLSARGSRLEWPLLVSVNLRVSTRRCCSYPAWRLVSCNNTVVLLPHRTR